MGFSDWLIKNGPGGVGSEAKFFCKRFSHFSSVHPMMGRDEVFSLIYDERVNLITHTSIGKSMDKSAGGIFSYADKQFALDASKKDLTVFVVVMLLLTSKSNRDVIIPAIVNGDEMGHRILKIIYQIVSDRLRTSQEFDYNEYYSEVKSFIHSLGLLPFRNSK